MGPLDRLEIRLLWFRTMRNFDHPFKTKQQWEHEMLDCLDEARRAYVTAVGAGKQRALEHYRIVLRQFQCLVVDGRIPPEEPCYGAAA